MTDAQEALVRVREALSAGPTPGPWCIHPETDGTEICAVDLVPGLPIRQVIAHPKHGANWIANARLIAACSPANVRELLAAHDALKADAERYRRWLRGGKEIPAHSIRWARWEVRQWDGRYWNTLFAEQMDAAIDAARGQA